jgi:3'(2'), 5'-bisphosphate nucleotidase
VLSEEAADDPGRLSAERVWIIDPLDGTREFGEHGRVDWAVHVALWERGELTAGAVALPAQGIVLSTAAAPARPTGPAGPAQGAAPIRLVVSRSRPPEFVRRLADLLGAELVPLGSAGAKAAAVIIGEVDAYVHSGGQYEWDTAAPVAVARSAGLHASRIDGSGLRYNCEHPWMPDILICPSSLADRILEAISEVSAGGLGAGRSVD